MNINITPISNINLFKPTTNKPAKTVQSQDGYSTLPFKGSYPIQEHSEKYLQAQRYLKLMEANNKENDKDIYDFNLNKLDGIQEGIDVFKGLNMKEIAFIGQSIVEVAVKRGCHNMCAHCYAGATPPLKEDDKHINKMSWNDFTSLTDGLQELNKRLGFAISQNPKETEKYMTSFHDADCIDMVLFDNEGKEHDFIDIAERLNDTFKNKQLFDTAGWNPKDKKAQARAEKYAEYYSEPENYNKIMDFNVSANPYHALHARKVLMEKEGNKEKADKFQDLYTTRMANVLYTFTPLLANPNYRFISRAASNYSKGTEGFRERDLTNLYQEIFDKLENKYYENLKINNNPKFPKNKKEIENCMLKYESKLYPIETTSPSVAERLSKIYAKDDEATENCEFTRKKTNSLIKKAKNVKDIIDNKNIWISGLLDSNGKYYLTNFDVTYPTELQLNFENKNKQTADIMPYLQKDIVVKRSTINSL